MRARTRGRPRKSDNCVPCIEQSRCRADLHSSPIPQHCMPRPDHGYASGRDMLRQKALRSDQSSLNRVIGRLRVLSRNCGCSRIKGNNVTRLLPRLANAMSTLPIAKEVFAQRARRADHSEYSSIGASRPNLAVNDGGADHNTPASNWDKQTPLSWTQRRAIQPDRRGRACSTRAD